MLLQKHCFRCVLLLFFIGNSTFLSAQVPANPIGLNPSSLKWNQISTNKVQVIFPKGLEQQGQRVAGLVHHLWAHQPASIGERQERVTILLHNQTILPNGFVTVGPFRSEFFLTPPQFDCTAYWLDLLTIHEYRHVRQFANGQRGLTRFARRLLGSWPWGGFMATALPRWYFEGDAVGSETALSRSGRGRLPAFDMEYRALLLEGRRYNYEKAGAGSLRDFVPSWYPLGYYMTTYARQQFGPAIWQKTMADAVQYKGLFFPFSKNLKKHSGLRTPELYQQTFDTLQQKWHNEAKHLQLSPSIRLNKQEKHTVIHYNLPLPQTDGSVITERSGFDEIPALVRIDPQGNEQRLTRPGIRFEQPNASLSQANGKLCWAEVNFDPRWRYQSFSVIKIFDLDSGKQRQLSKRSRYFSPALSPTADRIVAVEVNVQQQSHLVILDAANGEVLQRLPNPQQLIYSFPCWASDGQQIVVVAKSHETNFLQLIDLTEQTQRPLTDRTTHQLSHPYVHGDTIVFAGAYTGINNIFAVLLNEPGIYQLTSVLTSAFQPSISIDGTTLLYSEFSAMGFDLQSLLLSEALWKKHTNEIPFGIDFFDVLAEQEGGPITQLPLPDTFQVNRFNTWNNIIYPHSLLPFFTHPIAGFQLLSDNKFSTLSASAGGYFNYNDDQWTLIADLSYAQLYPVINLGYRRAERSELGFNFAPLTDTSITNSIYVGDWRENRFYGGLSLPLNLSRGHFSTTLFLRTDYQFIDLGNTPSFETSVLRRDTIGPFENFNAIESIFKEPLRDAQLHAMDLRVVFRTLRRRALQHLQPRLGVSLDLRYRSTLGSNAISGDVFQAAGTIYLPGLLRTHNFYLNGAYKKESLLDNYRFSDFYSYPRGYPRLLGERFWKVGANYSLPLAYPDVAIGPLAFLKRVKLNGFFDYGNRKAGFPFALDERYASAGAELTVDIRAIRLLEIDFGLRYSYLFDQSLSTNNSPHQFDFLLISISEQ